MLKEHDLDSNEIRWATLTRWSLADFRNKYVPAVARGKSKPYWIVALLLPAWGALFGGYIVNQPGNASAWAGLLRRVLPLNWQAPVLAWPVEVSAAIAAVTGAMLLGLVVVAIYQLKAPTQSEVMKVIMEVRRRQADVAAGRLSAPEIVRQAGIEQGVTLGWLGEGDETPARIGLAYAGGEGHCLTVGPTRSGKGLAITDTLLHWPASVVVLDPKGEQYQRTAGHRAALGQRIFTLPGDTLDLSQYFDLSRTEDASDLHANLLRAWMDREPIFAQKLLPFFAAIAAYARQKNLNPVRTLLTSVSQPLGRVLENMEAVVPDEIRVFTDGLPPKAALENRMLTSAWGTWTTRGFNYIGHLDTIAARTPTIPVDWEREGATIYVTYGLSDLRAMGPLVSAVIAAFIRRHMRGPYCRSLYILDELKLAALAGVSDHLAVVGSSGITLALYLQTLTQLEEIYGERDARTILSNCRHQAWYAPGDVPTAKHMSEMYGETFDWSFSSGDANQARFENANSARGPVVSAMQMRPVIKPTEFMSLNKERVFTVVSLGERQLRCISRRPNVLNVLSKLPPPPGDLAVAVDVMPLVATVPVKDQADATAVAPGQEPSASGVNPPEPEMPPHLPETDFVQAALDLGETSPRPRASGKR